MKYRSFWLDMLYTMRVPSSPHSNDKEPLSAQIWTIVLRLSTKRFFFRFYVPVPGHFRDMNQYRSFILQMCQSDMINRIRRSQLVCTFSWFSLDADCRVQQQMFYIFNQHLTFWNFSHLFFCSFIGILLQWNQETNVLLRYIKICFLAAAIAPTDNC